MDTKQAVTSVRMLEFYPKKSFPPDGDLVCLTALFVTPF